MARSLRRWRVRHARDSARPPRGALGYGWVDIAELRAHGITPQAVGPLSREQPRSW